MTYPNLQATPKGFIRIKRIGLHLPLQRLPRQAPSHGWNSFYQLVSASGALELAQRLDSLERAYSECENVTMFKHSYTCTCVCSLVPMQAHPSCSMLQAICWMIRMRLRVCKKVANRLWRFILKVIWWGRSCFWAGGHYIEIKKNTSHTSKLQIWHHVQYLTKYRYTIPICLPELTCHIPTHHNLPSCKLSLLSILLRLYRTAVLKLTSFMSWRSRRKGMGDGRQRVSSAHWDPLSYISSICLFVSFSNGCHWSLAASPHSQIACFIAKETINTYIYT